MMKFYGKGVSGGYAIGKVSLFKRKSQTVRRIKVDDIKAQINRFEEAKAKAIEQLNTVYEKAFDEMGEDNAQIFEMHAMMLDDDDYNDSIYDIIRTQSVNAEYAVAEAGNKFSEVFASMDDSYMQARSADVRDISNRVIACLSGVDVGSHVFDGQMIIAADDLVPSETVSLAKDKVLAFVTAYGSADSHTAILSRSMGIPAVIGVGTEFFEYLQDDDTLIVDGYSGEIILSPSDEELEAALEKQKEDNLRKMRLLELVGKENITLDGTYVNIMANIGDVSDIESVIKNDAGGIGLFRSEFLYLQSQDYPTEEQQFLVYRRVLEAMKDRKVIIRTLDIGADKRVDYFDLENEENPALGLRAIRLCLAHPDVFRTQLRALYRASAYGHLGIMFPMIISVSEVKKVLRICKSVRDELTEEGVPFNEKTELGIMIETPAAAIISDHLAEFVDFFSIGTNDLIQYTLACDRQNAELEPYCDRHHEAVFRLIEMSIKNAHRKNAWAGICGELAADLELTEMFLKMGVDEFSVSAPFVLPLREKVRSINLKKKQ